MNPSKIAPVVRRTAWAALAVNTLVALWGAFVRASGSGAGCGAHWPLCNGKVVPRSPEVATLVELSHRLTSAMALIVVGTLVVVTFRRTQAGHPLRRASTAAAGFLLVEAAIGAGLVLLGLVAKDASKARALWVAMHLVNTFLLLGTLTVASWMAGGGRMTRRALRAPASIAALGGLVALVVVATAGAVVALGDTLFPASSLAAGLAQDFAPEAHFLIRLRIIHPILAMATAAFLVFLVTYLAPPVSSRQRRLGRLVIGLTLSQLGIGALNLSLLAPIPIQIIHLAWAYGSWMVLVLYTCDTIAAAKELATPLVRDHGEVRPQLAESI